MYSVHIIHTAGDNRETILRQAMAREAARLGIPVDCLDPAQMGEPSRAPKAVVYLGNPVAKADAECQTRVQRAISLRLPIIPVIDIGSHSDQVPPELMYIKAITWSIEPVASSQELVTVLLDVLGITERERRVFISYRQVDAAPFATQIFHALCERRFVVFLDRFQMMPGENIQERIEEELEDISFVLLLQSPDMHRSPWVDWVITHALKSRLPLVILKWTNAPILPKLEGANFPTVELDLTTDLTDSALSPRKLEEIIQAVEVNHAEGLFRRRRESLVAARELAESRGLDVAEEPSWKLVLQGPGTAPTVLGITPRPSRVENLEELDSWAPPPLPVVGIRWRRLLMQTSTELSPRRRRLLEWAIGDRDLVILLGMGGLERSV